MISNQPYRYEATYTCCAKIICRKRTIRKLVAADSSSSLSREVLIAWKSTGMGASDADHVAMGFGDEEP